ncbi:uncharacterized protein [Solanum lycopersicum]|uniref:uncharacterized protein n=1 Tax=Solanum lycopersicum TaxID=4081 RepID=UPI003747CD84
MGKEEFLMAYFGESLTSVASKWFIDQKIFHWHIWDDMDQDFVRQFQYNIDIIPDRNTLSNRRKKPIESFREYTIKWREQAARAKPPLNEQELVDIFIEAQDPDYFHHLTAAMGIPCHTTIKIWEMIESGLKTGRIVSQATIKATTQAIEGGSTSFGNRKRNEEVISLASGSREAQRKSNCFQAKERCEYRSGAPRHITDNCWTLKGAIEKLIEHGVVVVIDDQNTPNVTNNPLPAHNNLVGMVCDDQEYKLLSKMGKLFSKIGEEDKSMKSLEPVASLSVEGANLDTKVLCLPGVSNGIEVRAAMPKLYLKEPISVKPVQQLLVIDSNVVPWNYNNTAVVYRGKEIVEEVDEAGGLTRSGRCYSPEELRKGKMSENIQVPLKKAVTEEENVEFLKKLKVLNEAHVPKETTVNQLENMNKCVFESNAIIFTNDELPKEGTGHNKALHLLATCEGYNVKRVMIVGGSGVDIYPLSTLQSLKDNTDKILPSNVFVRAYDSSRRNTISEIKLNMTIVPVVFMIVFKVMDMETSYNFLLGRPWILHGSSRPINSTSCCQV